MLANEESGEVKSMRPRTVFLRVVKGTDRPSHARPVLRGDCEPCSVCQGWRDSTAGNRWPRSAPGRMVDNVWVLKCGHTEEEAVMHSRPCVFVGCSRNLYLDVRSNGSVTFNHPHVPPQEAEGDTCSQDTADAGRVGPLRVARALNMSPQGGVAILKGALRKLRANKLARKLRY